MEDFAKPALILTAKVSRECLGERISDRVRCPMPLRSTTSTVSSAVSSRETTNALVNVLFMAFSGIWTR
jgi:hypothetical protein